MDKLEVYKGIVQVTRAMAADGISKGRTNQQQGYKFRGIDDVYNALSRHLADASLCILPHVIKNERRDVPTKSGGIATFREIEVKFTITSAVDGSSVEVVTLGEAMDTADKSSNKTMSAAYKYMALMLFAIPTEGDNDADATTLQRKARDSSEDLAPKLEKSIDWAKDKAAFVDAIKAAKEPGDLTIVTAKISDAKKGGFPAEWLSELRSMMAARKSEMSLASVVTFAPLPERAG